MIPHESDLFISHLALLSWVPRTLSYPNLLYYSCTSLSRAFMWEWPVFCLFFEDCIESKLNKNPLVTVQFVWGTSPGESNHWNPTQPLPQIYRYTCLYVHNCVFVCVELTLLFFIATTSFTPAYSTLLGLHGAILGVKFTTLCDLGKILQHPVFLFSLILRF